MSEIARRNVLSKVALGNIPPDTVITNGVLFDAFTREFIERQSIWIKDGMIAYVGPDSDPARGGKTEVVDADRMVLLPGLIDGQTHPFSSRSGVEEFIKHVIPSGVTTAVIEADEYAPFAGDDGVESMTRGLEGQPIRFYYTPSSLCRLRGSDEELFLKDLGLGKIGWTPKRRVQAGTKFDAFCCDGAMTPKEAVERLRLGDSVMVREGGARRELEGVKKIFERKIDFRRFMLATGGVDPEGFLTEGYLDASLRRALKLGVSPRLAYQMVTINVAEYFRLDHLIGSLSPGRVADIVTIPSPEMFSPQWVMCGGRMIFRDGVSLAEPRKVFFSDHMFNTIRIPEFTLPLLPEKGKVRSMELVTRFVTQEKIIDLENPEERKGVIMILALDRLGSGKSFMGVLKNFGLQKGAYGTTMSQETTDLIAAGCDNESMETVIGRLKEIGGGGVYALGKEIVAEFPAPLCGVVSLKPMAIVNEEVKRLEAVMRQNGVAWEKPVLTFDTLGTPAFPHLRITHRGYFTSRSREILSLEI
ncbi:MAG TPA: adenine deaminase C-terminal domain-containing protein [Thermodesulfobacteriota bacterium]|nr:adenine deaminase C-terminal domain-containing protein [Thermodesulfobacteriota bacterium]